jgi:single-stranded-DNA-specific exonuclease
MWGLAEPIRTRRHFLDVANSVTGRAWRSRLNPPGEAAATAMAQRGLASECLARVLAARDVPLDRVASFLSPSLRQDLPDPASLTDMEAAAARLADAVQNGQSVAIFGDYDVDGATSAALLQGVLAALGCPTRIYIPDRIFEGYGPNSEAIDLLIDGGSELIVCVDCGSTSFAPLDRARSRGIDVLVLDHHQVGAELPPAQAVVNPNRQDDVSGQGHLAAVGVTFLTAVALLRELRRRGHAGSFPDLLTFLDFVALGTVCDMVPLLGLNRAFVAKGLVALRHTERPGLRALIAAARLRSAPDCGHLGFLLGPRINAGGRIGEATLGARLLATGDPAEAEKIAATLERLNEERQAIEVAAVSEATAEAEAEIGAGPGPSVLLVSRDQWHPGIVGLVAARLKERFCRPAFAIAWNGAVGAGSGRSIPGVDIGAAVRAAVEAGILVKGGGHPMAAGITVERQNLEPCAPSLKRGWRRRFSLPRHPMCWRSTPLFQAAGPRWTSCATSNERVLSATATRPRSSPFPRIASNSRMLWQRPCPNHAGHWGGEPEGGRLQSCGSAARPSAAQGTRQAAACRRDSLPGPLGRVGAPAAADPGCGASRRSPVRGCFRSIPFQL